MNYTVSYDYRDYLEEEKRIERMEDARDELAQYPEDKEAFIQYVKEKNKNKRFEIISPEPLEKPEPQHEFDPEEIRKMVQEVFAFRDKNLAEMQKNMTLDKMIANSRAEYSTYEMFDFGLDKMSNHQAIMDFYGYDLYNRIEDEIRESYNAPSDDRKRGHITKALWQELKDIRSGRKKKPERKKATLTKSGSEASSPPKKPTEQVQVEAQVRQRIRQAGDDYYLKIERGVIRNESYLEVFKGPGTVYEVMWANIIRKDWHDTKDYPIRERYYEKGMLVYCTSYRDLAKRCKMSHNTVRRIIEAFEKAGVLKTELLELKDKKQRQTVFILGYWTGSGEDYEERYFKDEVFLSPRVVKK